MSNLMNYRLTFGFNHLCFLDRNVSIILGKISAVLGFALFTLACQSLSHPVQFDAQLPGRLEAEDFMLGVEGVTYHDVDVVNEGGSYHDTGVDIATSTDTDGSYYLGWTEDDEWLQYSIDIAESGIFDIDFRVASDSKEGRFHLELNGENITSTVKVPVTGGWASWQTFTIRQVELPAGQYTLKLVIENDGFNLNYIDFRHSEINQSLSCSDYGSPHSHGALPYQADEVSGLVVSDYSDRQFWGHNDSGAGAYLYGFDQYGSLLSTVTLANTGTVDWEDLSKGGCGDDSHQTCLYVADIGDNGYSRSNIKVRRLVEPNPEWGSHTVTTIETMTAVYEDGAHNAEAFVVDENGGLYIFTKTTNRKMVIYKSEFSNSGQFNFMAELTLSDLLPDASGDRLQVTGADYHSDSKQLIIRTYGHLIELAFTDELSLSDVNNSNWKSIARELPVGNEPQGETIAIGGDNYWHASEGNDEAIWHISCDD